MSAILAHDTGLEEQLRLAVEHDDEVAVARVGEQLLQPRNALFYDVAYLLCFYTLYGHCFSEARGAQCYALYQRCPPPNERMLERKLKNKLPQVITWILRYQGTSTTQLVEYSFFPLLARLQLPHRVVEHALLDITVAPDVVNALWNYACIPTDQKERWEALRMAQTQ